MCANILKDCVQNYVLQSTSDLVEIEVRNNQNVGTHILAYILEQKNVLEKVF